VDGLPGCLAESFSAARRSWKVPGWLVAIPLIETCAARGRHREALDFSFLWLLIGLHLATSWQSIRKSRTEQKRRMRPVREGFVIKRW
jgi:hypothetical protein